MVEGIKESLYGSLLHIEAVEEVLIVSRPSPISLSSENNLEIV
jgi:hypothetical protein